MMLRILAILMLTLLSSTLAFGNEGDVPQIYQVKAKYLLNIPLFTELPPQSLKGAAYTICFTGSTPLENILEASKPKMIKNRPLVIRNVESGSQLDGCQALFIASNEHYRLQSLLPDAHHRGILTISDMRDFTRLGGIIGLLIVNNRVTFDMNLAAAGKASITFSTHLLKLAHDTIN